MIEPIVQNGDMVVDATCGNGNDTLFLAGLVGGQGRVFAFDIQELAITNTRQRLLRHGVLSRVKLIQCNHTDIALHLDTPVRACMFNLGYLPGGNHAITTQPKETIQALNICINRLLEGGIITVVTYPGYQAGREEMVLVEEYLQSLSQQEFEVVSMHFVNQKNYPPRLLIIKKLGGGRV
ncbi:tRNA (mnm(5)s(2)U34)-methyltransferase [Syntrophomonas erecta]